MPLFSLLSSTSPSTLSRDPPTVSTKSVPKRECRVPRGLLKNLNSPNIRENGVDREEKERESESL